MNDTTAHILNWDDSGVIPPVDPENPVSLARSPYRVSLIDVIKRFGDTDRRRNLLSGLLNFRAELHKAGLSQGFQWIDGSFVEDVETIRGRPPNDIDITTFFYIPKGQTQDSLMTQLPALFDRGSIKERYGLDAFLLPLNQIRTEILVRRLTYYYGLWSHTRGDMQWKGYPQVDLGDSQDTDARAELDRMSNEGGGQP